MFSLNSPPPLGWGAKYKLYYGVISGEGGEVKGKGKKGRERVMQKSQNYKPPLFI